MTLIAFSGKLGSGKDTAGARMAEIVDVPSFQASFARPLKESAAALLDIPVEDWETYKNDPDVQIMLSVGYSEQPVPGLVTGLVAEAPNVIRQFTAREFLQRYGTEAHRHVFGDDFWVEQALSDCRPDQVGLTYVTDCRFINEAQAVLDRGGVVIRVTGANEETGSHASETPLPEAYITGSIDNSVRDDEYANLDRGLRALARMVGLPLKKEILA